MTMRRLLIAVVRMYQLTLRPLVGHHCRFFPTCSDYAITALQKHGGMHGLRLALFRLARCHPFSPGGCDPVPEAAKDNRNDITHAG